MNREQAALHIEENIEASSVYPHTVALLREAHRELVRCPDQREPDRAVFDEARRVQAVDVDRHVRELSRDPHEVSVCLWS